MNLMTPIHTDNSAIRELSPADISRLHIKLLWPRRTFPGARRIIRAYVRNVRAWSNFPGRTA